MNQQSNRAGSIKTTKVGQFVAAAISRVHASEANRAQGLGAVVDWQTADGTWHVTYVHGNHLVSGELAYIVGADGSVKPGSGAMFRRVVNR